MKVITAGHKYELENFEAKDQPGQVIQFIEKTAVAGEPGKLVTVNDGTTNEEVLKMLIDRCQSLYDKFPSEETACSISHLKSALYAQQSRTYERSQRGVEGKHLK
ncbi:MAG: hypothetical protein KGL39_55530 [Patescibacteria group bacterium]|nr:hypothetical protein [Patescibacteria group bacterium]